MALRRTTTVLAVLVALTTVLPAHVQAITGQPTEGSAPAPQATTASDLRIGLGRLLGEHAYLLMESMRAATEGGRELQALVDGVAENTDALRQAIEQVYGPEGGAAFEPLWQRHIDALIAWAVAYRAGDGGATQAALEELDRYRSDFGTFLVTANPRLSGDAEAHALQLHLDQLTAFVDQDYAASFATERAAYGHMFEFGDDLARGIVAQFPERFSGGKVAFSPRTSLRLDLGRLLGEHLILSAVATRTGLAERADSGAAADSLAANSADLTDVMSRVFGAEAGESFARVWDRHITTYLAYIEAVRNDDSAARGRALDDLHSYHTELAGFLHAALPQLTTDDLEQLISHHVSALINQIDAAAAGDHARTVAVTREAYAQMFEVGNVLAGAIADRFPERFEDLAELPRTDAAAITGPATGHGRARLICPIRGAADESSLGQWSVRPGGALAVR